MFDVAPTELLLIALVALIVIGPKDLPKAMRFVGHWVGKARGVARQFRSGFDAMVREAELAELEKQWAEENARIMREHPVVHEPPVAPLPPGEEAPRYQRVGDGGGDAPNAVMVEQPVIVDAPEVAPAAAGTGPGIAPDKAPS
jgi:sec-independent protein translocase protein TatB